MKLPFYLNKSGKLVAKRRRRFDVSNRAVLKAREEIRAAEDAAIFKIMDSLCDPEQK